MAENGTFPFTDEFVVYFSKEDNSWLAHSLHTDQIGLGDSVVDAIVDLLVGLNNLFEVAKKGDIYLAADAPPEIFLIRQTAKLLPDSIVQMVWERFYHQFPSEWSIQVNIPQSESVAIPMTFPLQECSI